MPRPSSKTPFFLLDCPPSSATCSGCPIWLRTENLVLAAHGTHQIHIILQMAATWQIPFMIFNHKRLGWQALRIQSASSHCHMTVADRYLKILKRTCIHLPTEIPTLTLMPSSLESAAGNGFCMRILFLVFGRMLI